MISLLMVISSGLPEARTGRWGIAAGGYAVRLLILRSVRLLGLRFRRGRIVRRFIRLLGLGGSTWWEPILDPESADTYASSQNYDMFSKPGTVIPANVRTQVGNAIKAAAA